MLWNRRSCRTRQGSIALEAALALPPVLFLIALFLHGLVHEQGKLDLTRAVDRAAAEIALVLPVVHLGRDWLESSLPALILAETGSGLLIPSLESGIEGEISEWAGAVETAGLKVFARSRIQYWLQQNGVLTALVDESHIDIRWEEDKHLAWLLVTQQTSWSGYPFRMTVRSVIPVWPGRTDSAANKPVDEPGESIWALDNFARGKAIRVLFQANLPEDFPVIAIWHNGEATAIHSIDLMAPTYQDRSEVTRAVVRRLNLLASFTGSDYKREGISLAISGAQITSRRLLLVIPENSSQPWLDETWLDLGQKARSLGVFLEIERYGASLPASSQTGPKPPG
ncbi:MAG: hypothetical protein EOM08_02840 [Clostridia bacterium]|nr:hypothetical protein [Clostridia bacterium]NCC75352.1 hypothetical protein [Clostridia bacterium]